MDAVTSAILAALPVLAKDTLKSSVKDAYAGLKEIIREKWTEAHGVVKAIDSIEQNPNQMPMQPYFQKRLRLQG